MRETVPSSEFMTQTLPAPTVTPLPPRPTRMNATILPVAASTRATRSSS